MSQQQTNNTTGFQITPQNTFEDTNRSVNYLCGDCDSKVTLKRGDPIRCKECGYRVLYKQRTNRYLCPPLLSLCFSPNILYSMIQFEAR